MALARISSFLGDLQNQDAMDDMTRKGFSCLTSVMICSFLHCYLLSFLLSFLPFLRNTFHLNTASLLTCCAWYHYSISTYYSWTSIFFLCNHMQSLSFSITQPTFLLYLPWSLYYEHCLICVLDPHLFKLNDIFWALPVTIRHIYQLETIFCT